MGTTGIHKNCQSCGMPLSRDVVGGGTNADGSRSGTYCSHCWQDGRFTLPDITMVQMQERVRGKLREFGIPGFLTGFFTRGIPKLERWRRTGGTAVSFLLALALSGAGAAAGAAETVRHLDSGKIFPPGLPFSEAVRVDDLVFLSGQIGIAPGTMTLVPGGIQEEARQTMENIRTSLAAQGIPMSRVVKCTVMLADIAEWAAFNEVYKTFFEGRYPARSALGANGLALGAKVEVECIAAAGKRAGR